MSEQIACGVVLAVLVELRSSGDGDETYGIGCGEAGISAVPTNGDGCCHCWFVYGVIIEVGVVLVL